MTGPAPAGNRRVDGRPGRRHVAAVILLAWLAACSPDPAPGDWVAAEVPNLVLAQRLTSADFSGAASAVCTADGDPDERHVVGSAAVGTAGLAVYGLLADTDYTCAIDDGERSATVPFHTGVLPDFLPSWEVTGDAGWGGYTIFNHGTDIHGDRQSKILVVDREGRLRWYYEVPYQAPDLDVSYLGSGQILYGGGYAAPPTVVDLAGQVLLRAAEPDVYHHHAERLPTGEFAVLTLDTNTDGNITWNGMEIEILDPAMTHTVWSWATQRGVDEGWLPVSAGSNDPYHMNAIQVTDEAVYANFRNLSILVKLDRETGDLEWILGANGEFALLDATGAAEDPASWFYGAHAPEIDGNRILLHDNGFPRPGGNWSRIAEFEIDEAARTARMSWDYTEEGWFEPIWGDADRLPDGHVLYTRAHCESCNPDAVGNTQIVEIDPAAGTVLWRLLMSDVHDAGYRSQRIDGCDIFANARYCPDL
jgi:hypothetical protein